jgi:hypothetical protein
VTFSIDRAVVDEATGYGKGGSEKKGEALGVRFAAKVPGEPFLLDRVDSAYSFKVGTVQFLEPKAHGGVTGSEIDNLDVSWTLHLSSPLASVETVSAKASVLAGTAIKYTLDWIPKTVGFGNGGKFEIRLHDLRANGKAPVDQLATITLLALPAEPEVSDQVTDDSAVVPEPGSLALLLGGLAGVIATRRRRLPA